MASGTNGIGSKKRLYATPQMLSCTVAQRLLCTDVDVLVQKMNSEYGQELGSCHATEELMVYSPAEFTRNHSSSANVVRISSIVSG